MFHQEKAVMKHHFGRKKRPNAPLGLMPD